jgi:hypothetical protein
MAILQDIILPNEPKDNLSVNVEPELISEKNGIIKKIYFLICGSCFWCASYYDTNNLHKVTKCPCCDNSSIESMPISHNEVYNLSHDSKRGITLEFANAEALKI